MEQKPGKTTRAWRNLFGSVDHEQLQQDFQHMLYNSVEGAQHKWNFDFLRDMLAEGVLQWEELRSHRVPAFYHSCVVGDDYYRAKKRIKMNMQAASKKSTS